MNDEIGDTAAAPLRAPAWRRAGIALMRGFELLRVG
jgi:hypothetical protein